MEDERLDRIIELRRRPGALDRMAAHVREHRPDAAADADAWETPAGRAHHGIAGWLYEVAIEHPAAFDAALGVA